MRIFLSLLITAAAWAQTATMPSTRLARAIDSVTTMVYVTDVSPVLAPALPYYRDPGDPTGGPGASYLFIEQEALLVDSIVNGVIKVERGVQGTYPAAHQAGMMVLSAPGHFYNPTDPLYPCLPDQTVLPVVVLPTGKVWNCGAASTRPGIVWAQGNFTWSTAGPQKAQQPWTDSTLLCQVQSITPPVFWPDTNISPCIVQGWAPGINWTESNFTWNSQGANWNALLNIF